MSESADGVMRTPLLVGHRGKLKVMTPWVCALALLALSTGLTHIIHVALAGKTHDSERCGLCALMSTTKPLLEDAGEPPLVDRHALVTRAFVSIVAPGLPQPAEPRKTRAPPRNTLSCVVMNDYRTLGLFGSQSEEPAGAERPGSSRPVGLRMDD